jgi:hypothetical protein
MNLVINIYLYEYLLPLTFCLIICKICALNLFSWRLWFCDHPLHKLIWAFWWAVTFFCVTLALYTLSLLMGRHISWFWLLRDACAICIKHFDGPSHFVICCFRDACAFVISHYTMSLLISRHFFFICFWVRLPYAHLTSLRPVMPFINPINVGYYVIDLE